MLFYSHGTKKKSKKLACNANRKIMSITKKQTKQKNSPPNKKTPHQSKTNKPMHLGVCILDLKEISLHSNEWSPAVEQPFVTVWPFVPEKDNHCLIGRLYSVWLSHPSLMFTRVLWLCRACTVVLMLLSLGLSMKMLDQTDQSLTTTLHLVLEEFESYPCIRTTSCGTAWCCWII